MPGGIGLPLWGSGASSQKKASILARSPPCLVSTASGSNQRVRDITMSHKIKMIVQGHREIDMSHAHRRVREEKGGNDSKMDTGIGLELNRGEGRLWSSRCVELGEARGDLRNDLHRRIEVALNVTLHMPRASVGINPAL